MAGLGGLFGGQASAATQVVPAAAQAGGNGPDPRQQRNLEFLRSAYRKYEVLANAQGSGFTQPYAPGSTLIWDVPQVNGGYLESVLVQVSGVITLAAGTAAVYGLTAAAPYSLFDYAVITYDKEQIRIPPVVLKWLAQLQGYTRAQPEQVVAGQTVSFVGNTVWGSPFGVAVGANTWSFWFRIPLRLLARHAAGMIPIGPNSTKCQVKLQCAANGIVGPDPLTNTLYAVSGTGQAVTSQTLSVKVEGIYRNGENMRSINVITPDLTGEPTIQWFSDRMLNPLPAGSLQKLPIDQKLQHLFAFLVVIDGNQSTKFAADSNFQAIEFLKDADGTASFMKFGTQGNNVNTTEFFEQYRAVYGQDLDEGVLPFVAGPGFLAEPNPDNMDGLNVLNMMGQYGYNAAQAQIQVQTVTSAGGMTPRMQWYLVSLNPVGLVLPG